MNPVHFSSAKEDWETPQDLFDELNEEFEFGLDAAASETNAKCPFWISKGPDLDSLSPTVQWRVPPGFAVWLNPPYGRGLKKWVKKASETARAGTTVVMLIPARPDTRYWAEYIWNHEYHRPREGVEVRFLKGRLKFGGAKSGAPFPSAIVIFRGVKPAEV